MDASTEQQLLEELLEAGTYKSSVLNSTSDVEETLKTALRKWSGEKDTSSVYVCFFASSSSREEGGVRTSFSWAPSGSGEARADQRPETVKRFDINGTSGESAGNYSMLYFKCVLPGDLRRPSRHALLRARASNTSHSERKGTDEAMRQHLSFVYLMSRRVTEALGCENEPLKVDPVVKPALAKNSEVPPGSLAFEK
ncbi:hypothetical protein HHL19_00255 [Streptomyces sp. R302]|uniref:hypothetical protein n=1 Tax=unclassified Streptomyces TaxID=2593676 RepID=UPI00145F6603|nr:MULTISPECIES: hypothetical protein [unclassified Streptomyces]NML48806.1 hypothetical protein [Streptomyces sp. R301]NML77133.1 hypothetical protein [Streptomyces sp. R302]